MSKTILLSAGLPTGVIRPFHSGLKKGYSNLHVLETLPMASERYTPRYARDLYNKAVAGLPEIVHADVGSPWDSRFVVLYIRKSDGSERHLIERFGLEALLIPLVMGAPGKAPKKHQSSKLANNLLKQTKRLLGNAQGVLSSVALQLKNRDVRTCLLLPRANYGAEFEKVKNFVQEAVTDFDSMEAFDSGLKAVADRLPKDSEHRFRSGELVFRGTPRARGRHGSTPTLLAKGDHDDRCVIRGHIRFGAPYDPKFHYDCDLPQNHTRRFTSCHGEHTLRRGRTHVNIAPNDNVR